ncbi:PIG-L family deacetylase [Candidatus Uabimicrobium sp. HlEnr_7]|uniref:PIG-L family deacetylase n=1 Tax=Candidatus Uabimicrobium helgolandensis TaxID=3095367 RepID=UPI003556E545
MKINNLNEMDNYDDIYISSHLDDVGFSCPTSILNAPKNRRILVVTIFSEGKSADCPKFLARQQEEHNASIQGGYDYIFAQFNDIRKSKVISHNGLIWSELTETQLIESVRAWLVELFDIAKPKTVFVPIGVGRHIDHRITHITCNEVLINSNIEVWYYEDRPYALVPQSTEVFLRELGYQVDVRFEVFLDNLFTSGFLGRSKPKVLEQRKQDYNDFVKRIANQETTKSIKSSRFIYSDNLEQVWKIISCYKSQLKHFIGGKETFFRDCRIIAIDQGRDEVYCERQWQL